MRCDILQVADGHLNDGTTVSVTQLTCPAGAQNGSLPLPACFKVEPTTQACLLASPTVSHLSQTKMPIASKLISVGTFVSFNKE
jgi:hypothetical protein